MDFLESVQSKFQKYHKKNNISEFRKLRSETHRETQKEQRVKKVDEGRNLKDMSPCPLNRKQSPHTDRLTKLKLWKMERENKKKQQKAVQKPSFKVGAPRNVGFPTLKSEGPSFAPKNHIFKAPQLRKEATAKNKEDSKVSSRVTRSQKLLLSPPVPLPVRTRKQNTKQNKENQNVGTSSTRKSRRKSIPDDDISDKEEQVPVKKTPPKRTITTSILANISPENTYVSPYVTTSRGKGSVRKENLNRSLRGLQSYSEAGPSECSANYFFTVLNNEIGRLQELCDTWTLYKERSKVLTEDAKDLIDVAIGQAQLLMKKKFKQFEGLIIECLRGPVRGEKEVTDQDLQGFWDMMYIQVENIIIRFNKLTTLKNNNWQEDEPTLERKVVKKRVAPKTSKPAAASSGIRAAILAARKKKQGLAPPDPEVKEEESVFDGGFFEVRTPNKNTPKKHTPGPTPKSILKSNKKSIANLNKSVLFKDEDSESEESSLNTTFEKSPPKKEKTPRKRRK